MFAVIRVSGKQYRVKEKDVFKTEKLPTEVGKEVPVTDILLLLQDGKTVIGTPRVPGATVMLKIRETDRGRKVRVFKMKAKKRYKRLYGHRQPYSLVEVTKIKT